MHAGRLLALAAPELPPPRLGLSLYGHVEFFNVNVPVLLSAADVEHAHRFDVFVGQDRAD